VWIRPERALHESADRRRSIGLTCCGRCGLQEYVHAQGQYHLQVLAVKVCDGKINFKVVAVEFNPAKLDFKTG